MRDNRLLGRWRSDGQRTKKEIAARRDISAERRKRLRPFFGRMELRFTRSRYYSTIDGETHASRYTVLAKDADSVVTLSEGRIGHIHFEGARFWILVGSGAFREFFRRLE